MFSIEELSEIIGINADTLLADIQNDKLVVTVSKDGYTMTGEDMVNYLEEVVDAPSEVAKQEYIALAVRRLNERL